MEIDLDHNDSNIDKSITLSKCNLTQDEINSKYKHFWSIIIYLIKVHLELIFQDLDELQQRKLIGHTFPMNNASRVCQ